MTRTDAAEDALARLKALLDAPDAAAAAAALASLQGVDRAHALPEVLGGGTLGDLLDVAAAGLRGEADPQEVADALAARLSVLDAVAEAEATLAHEEAADAALAGLSWVPAAPAEDVPPLDPIDTVPWTFDLD